MKRLVALVLLGSWLYGCSGTVPTPSEPVTPETPEILFLGHASEHHNSSLYAPILKQKFAASGIHLSYAESPDVLNDSTLADYDGLILYANHNSITDEQEAALLAFVESGKGFVPLHSASACFKNSKAFINLVGGQFDSHSDDHFTAEVTNDTHPITSGFEEFESWDETYVHHKFADDIEVLMIREGNDRREPYTWTRTQGMGRVFYTALGHDDSTWTHPGFLDLVERGTLWAIGDKAKAEWAAVERPGLEYYEAKLPNYEKRQPNLFAQKPLDPEASQRHIQVPPGFELTLFASEPDVVKPIAFTWDERGRMWVLETSHYPNQVTGGADSDRIKILEDTTGDGRADKVTVFADDLRIPTGLALANGGVIVAQAPHFIFLKDTDGDDVADERETLFSGWGTYDTHAGPSNLRYAPDNTIWGMVGYSSFKGKVSGEDHAFTQGFYRFDPDGTNLEYLSKTSNNTWGIGFSEDFDVFASTANNNHSVFMGIPNRYYTGVTGLKGMGTKKIDGHYAMHANTGNIRQVDVFGGFTAASGHNLYTARTFPKDFWNRVALVTEPTGHLLHKAILEKDGSSFMEKDGWNLMASTDEWVSPVHAEVGPDGSVWIADWYNFIIQHNPLPEGFTMGKGNAYETDLRDKTYGRIYRLSYKSGAEYEPMSLSKDDPAGLVAALSSDNMFWRQTAQRLLVERGETDVVPQLLELVTDNTTDEIGINGGAFHAIWTLDGLGQVGTDNAAADRAIAIALQHKAPGVRRAAIEVFPRDEVSGERLLAAGLLDDDDLRVTLAATLALSEVPSSEKIGEAIYQLSIRDDAKADPWLPQATYIAASKHREGFLAAMETDMGENEVARITDEALALPMQQWPREDHDVSDWESIKAPASWHDTQIGRFIGVAWFRRTLDLDDVPAGLAQLRLGWVDEHDDTWVNGVKVGATQFAWEAERVYDIPEGVLRAGANTIVVRIRNDNWNGGFMAEPEDFVLAAGGVSVPLAGDWMFKKEEVFEHGKIPDLNPELSIGEQLVRRTVEPPEAPEPEPSTAVVMDADTRSIVTQKPPAVVERQAPEAPPVVEIEIGAEPGIIAFDKKEITVKAGSRVRITFKNPDSMQHNLLVLQPGSLDEVGAMADQMLTQADAAEKAYVPGTDKVIVATGLVNPSDQETIEFVLPDVPGEYPFVCTFPGHWRLMQGVLIVE